MYITHITSYPSLQHICIKSRNRCYKKYSMNQESRFMIVVLNSGGVDVDVDDDGIIEGDQSK